MSSSQKEYLKQLTKSEHIIDAKINTLDLWERSFQTNICNLLYFAGYLEFTGSADNAMNYLGRVSSLWDIIKSRSAKAPMESSSAAFYVPVDGEAYLADVNRLYAYAHFSMLMPQLHRRVFEVGQSGPSTFSLSYRSADLELAEVKDKILGMLAQPFAISSPYAPMIRTYVDDKISQDAHVMGPNDDYWLEKLFMHHLNHSQRVEILGDDVLQKQLGFTNTDFERFSAALLALSDHLIITGQAYHEAMVQTADTEMQRKSVLLSECIEWTACTFSYHIFDLLQRLSTLEAPVFNAILSYFCLEYEATANVSLLAKGIAKDGYLPPFILTADKVIFSPYTLRYFYAFNNLLYSIKEGNVSLFDNHLSSHLEPVMIRQTERLFAKFKDVRTKANVLFPGGEMDLLVLSEKENVCLAFQMKATLAPSSSRTVARVEERSLEGIAQIERFINLDKEVQQQVIADAFGIKSPSLKIVHILMVRASAGQEKVWSTPHNIVNYNFLCGLLGKKLKAMDETFANFSADIDQYMNELIQIAKVTTTQEQLSLDELSITFPDQQFEDISLLISNLKHAHAMGDYLSAD